MAAIQWLKRTGQISDEKREEFILASDVLGLSMLVVQMNHRFDPEATPATVLGPFHIDGSPELELRRGHVRRPARDAAVHHRHRARGLTARRSRGAVLDVWQADEDGAYEAQLERRGGPAAREVHHPRGRHLLPAHHRPARATRSRWTARSAS